MNCRTGAFEEFECKCLILATGGAGQLYKFNTNSEIATGRRLGLAFKAGAELTDMEFFPVFIPRIALIRCPDISDIGSSPG